MNKKQKTFIAICAALLLLIVVVSIYNVPPKPQGLVAPKPTPALIQGDPVPGVYSCAQCIANNCYQATCNLSCEYFPNGCTTLVSGFMEGEAEEGKAPSIEPLFSGVMGVPLRFVRSDLAALGVMQGDVLTHINHEYIGGDINRLASLSADLKKGDVLFLFRNGKRFEVVL